MPTSREILCELYLLEQKEGKRPYDNARLIRASHAKAVDPTSLEIRRVLEIETDQDMANLLTTVQKIVGALSGIREDMEWGVEALAQVKSRQRTTP